MSVQQHLSTTTSNLADLETTAELPVLDVPGGDTGSRDHLGSIDPWAATPETVSTVREGELEAQLRDLAETLRDVEERLHHKGARLLELEREIQHFHDERRAAAERMVERDARIRELETRGPDREASAQEIGDRGRLLTDLRRQLAEAQARAVSHLETLQTLEARRGIWDLLFDGLDREVNEREARLAVVEAELSRRSGHTSEVETELAARTARVEALAQEVISLTTALASERADRARSIEENAVKIAAQAESITLLRKGLHDATGRAQEFESDLRAAEDTIHRLEAELRSKSLRVEELAKASEEWRHTAETVRRSLEERDARIHRLEADAAALVGNIKHSLERLEPPTGIEPPPEGATRLLVRATGESEVVHVLGRKTTVGRTPDNDLQIDARFISRHHAVILAGPVQTIIEDLNSTNGVRVNSRRVSRHVLKDGDVVIIGKTRFRFAVRAATQRS